MEIKETLFTKSFSTETDNPHGVALEFMKKLSDHYMIYEKENKFLTDGPVKKSVISFDAVETLDKFTSIIINFSMQSDNETLYVDVECSFLVRVKEEGFFSSAFLEFYLNNVFPVLKKISENRVKSLEKEVETI